MSNSSYKIIIRDKIKIRENKTDTIRGIWDSVPCNNGVVARPHKKYTTRGVWNGVAWNIVVVAVKTNGYTK